MEPIRFELSDAGDSTPLSLDRVRRNVRRLRLMGTGLCLLTGLTALVAIVSRDWPVEIIIGMSVLAALGVIMLVNARQRSAWVAAHAGEESIRLGVSHAFCLCEGSLVFPAQPGRPEETWPIGTIDVSTAGTGSKKWLVLRSSGRRTRRYPQFVLRQDVTRIAEILQEAAPSSTC